MGPATLRVIGRYVPPYSYSRVACPSGQPKGLHSAMPVYQEEHKISKRAK